FFFQAEDGIRDFHVTGVQTCALPISAESGRYIRSRPMLWQRLDAESVARIGFAVTTLEQQQELDALLKLMPVLQQVLAALPRAIYNPDLGQDSIWVFDAHEKNPVAVLLNWGRWTLEPVGAGWPEAERELKALAEALETAATKRRALARVHAAGAELAALCFALEREFNRQRYNQALELIPRILERL